MDLAVVRLLKNCYAGLLLLALSGCFPDQHSLSAPVIELCDDQIIAVVLSATGSYPYWDPSSHKSESYVIHFKIPANGEVAAHGWIPKLPDDEGWYWRSFSDGAFGTRVSDDKDWKAQLLRFKDKNTSPVVVKTWAWKECKSPPVVVTNDGTHFATKDDGWIVHSSRDLSSVPGISAAFLMGIYGERANGELFPPDLSRKLDCLIAHETEWKPGSVVIGSRFGKGVRFPDYLGGSGGPSYQVWRADEADSGEFLLFCQMNAFQRQQNSTFVFLRADLTTYKSKVLESIASLYKDNGYTSEHGRWDPAGHRVAFADSIELSRNDRPVQVRVWDYERDTMQSFQLDIKGAFATRFGRFVPR